MDIDALGVDVVFELSSDTTFSANLSYPSELSALYKEAGLRMECVNQTLNIKMLYPNGEFKQTEDIESVDYAKLIIRVPQRQYNKVKLNIMATNSETTFVYSASEIEINKVAGDVSFTLLNACNNLMINNKAGDFSLHMSPLAKSIVIQNKVGEFNVYLANDPSDFDLQITNVSTSGWELPNHWNYSELEGEWVKYYCGAGSNKMSFTNEIGNINFFIGQ